MMIEERDANLEKLQWGIGTTSEKVWWPGWTWFGYYTYKYCDQVQQKPDKNSSPWGGNYQLPVSLQHSNYPEWFHDLPKVNHCFSNAGCPSRHRTSSINMTYNSSFYTQRDGKWVRAKVQWHSAAGQQWHREGRGTVYPGPRLIVGIPGQAAYFLKEVNATKIQSWFSISNETSQLCACLCPAVRGGAWFTLPQGPL